MNEAMETGPARNVPEPGTPTPALHHKLIERVVLFVAVFVFWLLLVWPFAPAGGRPLGGDIAAGVVSAALVSLVMRDVVTQNFLRLLNPLRYFWAGVYLVVFGYYALKASFDVMYRVLHPALPINPGIVRVKTRLKSASARTALANSITLTPGTLTIDATEDGVFYVHWINVVTVEDEAAAVEVLGRFEWLIQKIFE